MEREWIDYVKAKAKEFGVPAGTAMTLFHVLGPSEAFDGFITMLEDMALEIQEQEDESETQDRRSR